MQRKSLAQNLPSISGSFFCVNHFGVENFAQKGSYFALGFVFAGTHVASSPHPGITGYVISFLRLASWFYVSQFIESALAWFQSVGKSPF